MTLEQHLQEVVERGEVARIALERLQQIDTVVRVWGHRDDLKSVTTEKGSSEDE